MAAAMHAAMMTALLSHAPARQTLDDLAPIMVSLIQPQKYGGEPVAEDHGGLQPVI